MVESDFLRQRRLMTEFQIKKRGITDEKLLNVFLKVPRHLFVPSPLVEHAYSDFALPIDAEQTISQPYIVALMLDALQIKKDYKILEIGTGSGYQTAILAELANQIFTMDRIPLLVQKAHKRLNFLGYKNINYRIDDGTLGWSEYAPYDAIVVSAAAPSIPLPLFNQLANRGRMIIPIGVRELQRLKLIKKVNNQMEILELANCKFVPLVGKQGWEE